MGSGTFVLLDTDPFKGSTLFCAGDSLQIGAPNIHCDGYSPSGTIANDQQSVRASLSRRRSAFRCGLRVVAIAAQSRDDSRRLPLALRGNLGSPGTRLLAVAGRDDGDTGASRWSIAIGSNAECG